MPCPAQIRLLDAMCPSGWNAQEGDRRRRRCAPDPHMGWLPHQTHTHRHIHTHPQQRTTALEASVCTRRGVSLPRRSRRPATDNRFRTEHIVSKLCVLGKRRKDCRFQPPAVLALVIRLATAGKPSRPSFCEQTEPYRFCRQAPCRWRCPKALHELLDF